MSRVEGLPTPGALSIMMEREEQIQKGYTDEHDDSHPEGELARVGAWLVLGMADQWGIFEKHRDNRIKTLKIAGALIAAEIDLLLRKQARECIENCETCGGGGVIDQINPYGKDSMDVLSEDCPDCEDPDE